MSVDEAFRKLQISGGLLDYFKEEFETLERTLNDDQYFCQQEIASGRSHLEQLKKKFLQKCDQLADQLDQLEKDNEEICQENKKQYESEIEQINDQFCSGLHHDAWKRYQQYKKEFEQRQTVITRVPVIPINDSVIDDLFADAKKPSGSTTTTKSSEAETKSNASTTATNNGDDDDDDDSKLTAKERLRRTKVVEKVKMSKEQSDHDDDDGDPNEENGDVGRTRFANQPIAPTNGERHSPAQSTTTIASTSAPKKFFSTRLNTSLVKPQTRPVVTLSPTLNVPPSTENPLIPRAIIPVPSLRFQKILLDMICDYGHDKHGFVLMAATARHIVIYKCQAGRVDRYHLGSIERGSSNTQVLPWHEGVIISMGFINNDILYIFTEQEFIQYSLELKKKVNSRMLPRGNDNMDQDTSGNPHENPRRAIGTVANGYVYHLYSNRTSHWVLSQTKLENQIHICDHRVTQLIEDVDQWINVDVNKKSINFLVRLNTDQFALIFCSLEKCEEQGRVIIPADQPKSLCSVFIPSMKDYVFFVNDPFKRELHILNRTSYLESYKVSGHAIYYVEEKHQLLIASDRAIFAMNLNTLDST